MIKNSAIYLGSSVLNKSVPFLLLPIITQYLSPGEYGELSIFMVFITVYTAFIGMNVHTNISKNFFKVSKTDLAGYIGNILFILMSTTTLYFGVTLVGYAAWDEVFSLSTSIVLLIPLIVAMNVVNSLNVTILRNEQKAYAFGLFEISNTLVKMGVTVLLLVAFGFGWHAQVAGVIVSSSLFFLVGLIYMFRREYIDFTFDGDKTKSILRISIPLIPHVLGAAVIVMSDRLFIERMVSLEAVGIYTVGYSFGMIVMLFSDAFIKAWSPWFYKNLAEPTDSKKQRIVKYTYIYIGSIFLLALVVSFIAEAVLPYFVTKEFYEASEFIIWVALGYAIRGVYQVFFPYLVHLDSTSFLAVCTTLAALLNLVLNYILIDLFGTVGAAYATALAFLLSAVLVFVYQQRKYHMPWIV